MDYQDIAYIFNSGLSRNQQIAELIKLDIKSRDIQTIKHCGPNIICKVRHSLNLTGSAPEQSKMGRPSIKTPAVKSFIVEQTFSNPLSSGNDLHNQIKDSMNIDISRTTINEVRGECGYKFLPPIQEPLLTEIQIIKRLNFCYTVLIHRNNLPFIGFSDESRFGLGSDKRWVWRKRNEYNPKAVIQREKFATSVMAWGMIGLNYKPDIYIYESTENSEKYVEMLIDNSYLADALTFFDGEFAFQQDGARPHTAKVSIESITNICDLVTNWPPNSPDLNVIEMVWSLMENVISFYHPANKEELIEAINIAWNSIEFETINKLCSSFVGRCYLCLKNRGHCIQKDLKKGLRYDISDEEIQSLFEELKKEGIILKDIPLILQRKIEE